MVMPWPKSMLGEIVLLALVTAVLGPVYFVVAAMRGEAPLALAWPLMRYAVPVALLAWIAADAKQRRRTPCFDFGLFLLVLWPFSLFWHCIATRGWRGLALAVGLYLLCGVPMMFMTLVDVLRAIRSMTAP
jgi:hypothetical protein